MDFTVIKIGAVMFDALHAYGLALFLGFVTQSFVEVADEGHFFRLRCQKNMLQLDMAGCIRSLLEIPSAGDLRVNKESLQSPTLALSKLDGVLAVLFTSPGLRVVSVWDVLNKVQFNSAAPEQSLDKAASAIKRWIRNTTWIARQRSDWMDHLLSAYMANQPAIPIPIFKGARTINISMPIDPVFSYSTRQPFSDGTIADKTNISVTGTAYAPILAIIGAAHFLRGHRVTEDMVVFYVPIVESMLLSAEMTLPLLRPSTQPVDHTLVRYWIERGWERAVPGACWFGLAYQILQTQGAQQSISRGCGCLDYAWLEMIEQRAGSSVINHWHNLLR